MVCSLNVNLRRNDYYNTWNILWFKCFPVGGGSTVTAPTTQAASNHLVVILGLGSIQTLARYAGFSSVWSNNFMESK